MPRNPSRDKDLIRSSRTAVEERPKRTFKPAVGVGLALALVLVPVALGVVKALWGNEFRDPIVALACTLTGCTAPGMVVAGWLIIMVLVVWAAVGILFLRRWGNTGRWAYAAAGFVVILLTWMFIPGRGTELDDLLDGYGEYAFATGLRWGGLSAVAIAAIAITGAIVVKRWQVTVVASAIAAAVLLGVGISRGVMPPMTAAAMFTEKVWTSAGDTLTVTSTADQDGCDGVVANQPLLDGCIRTARATFTTDDSDAVVEMAAVLFPSQDTAEARRDDLPAGTGQQGITGATRSTRTVTEGWLILTSVRHADGRAIPDADAGYLLWALKQAGYRFTSIQVGLDVAPDPKPPIAPRTP